MTPADVAVLLTAVTGAVMSFVAHRRTRRSDRKIEGTSAQEALNEGFKQLIDDYQQRVADVRAQYEEDLRRIRERYQEDLDAAKARDDELAQQVRNLKELLAAERKECDEKIDQMKREFILRFVTEDNAAEDGNEGGQAT